MFFLKFLRWTRFSRRHSRSAARLGTQHLLYPVIPLGRDACGKWLAFDDHVELVGIQNFALQKGFRNADQNVAIAFNQLLGIVITLIDEPAYLGVDLASCLFTEVTVLCNLATQEDLLILLAECQRPKLAHTPFA